MQIIIKEYTHLNMDEILELYKAVSWENYTNNPEMLKAAIENSLKVLGAYNNHELVGLIRVVGDGSSIIYIQDILVKPEYQGKGIGKRLLNDIDVLYSSVYQKVLLTDNQVKTMEFYKSCGFTPTDEIGCASFLKIKH